MKKRDGVKLGCPVMVDESVAKRATGGDPPYKWSISSGHLPKGLHLKKATGVISGTHTQVLCFGILI